MNCPSNLKFNFPTFTLIRAHPRPSAVEKSSRHPTAPHGVPQFLAFFHTPDTFRLSTNNPRIPVPIPSFHPLLSFLPL